MQPWLLRFRAWLTENGYSRFATKNYCVVVRHFLTYLERKAISVEAVTPDHVEAYLCARLRGHRRRHGCDPRSRAGWYWHLVSPIRALLRLAQGRWPPPNKTESELIDFRRALVEGTYCDATVRRYLEDARHFLRYLNRRSIPLEGAKTADVTRFLEWELRAFRRKHGHLPPRLVQWRCGWTTGIHALLRLAQGQWPPPGSIHPWLLRLQQYLKEQCSDRKTRLHYLHACGEFLKHCERSGVKLESVDTVHVTAYCRLKLRLYRKRHNGLPRSLHKWQIGIQVPIHRLLRLMNGSWPPAARPDPTLLIYREHLCQSGFQPSAIARHLSQLRGFLGFLHEREVRPEEVQPAHVELFLKSRLEAFKSAHQRFPANPTLWRYQLRAPICRFLRLIRGKWPPDTPVADELEVVRRDLCARYGRWLTEMRGLSPETLRKNGDAARLFLRWLGERARPQALQTLTISDIDHFLAWRNAGLRRATRLGVSQCLRSFLGYLYGEGLIAQDLAQSVPSPSQYRFESIPSALSKEQVQRLLEMTQQDRRPEGLRDYAILLLIKTYGLRAGEVVRLRLEDINWRRDQIRLWQSKTRADLWLPLTPAVGEALLDYLRNGRPQGGWREVFLRAQAPCGPFVRGSSLYSVMNRRLKRAGIQAEGKHGPHALRYARAVELLRASVPLKSIGDILGHRSAESTQIYLKLATEDLRSIALEIPVGARQ